MTTQAEENQTALVNRTAEEEARAARQRRREAARKAAAAKAKAAKDKVTVERIGVGPKDVSSIQKSIESVRKQLVEAAKRKDLRKAQNLSQRMQALIKIRNSDA